MATSPLQKAGGGLEIRKCHTVREIGKGSYGSVSLALRPDGRFMAVKKVHIEKNEDAGNAVKDFVKEVGVMNLCRHTNIVGYMGSSYEETDAEFVLMIFQEYVTGGSASALCRALASQREKAGEESDPNGVNGIPYAPLRVFSRHITLGLQYLHSKNIAHRDLKGDNVLVSHDTGLAKLADFGAAHSSLHNTLVATKAGDTKGGYAGTFVGTPYWMAPEVILSEKGYDPRSADLWSLGCTVAEMWTGVAPWKPAKQLMTTVYAIAQSKGWPDAIPKAACPPELKEFLEACFQRDPKKRLGTTELLQMAFMDESQFGD